MNFGKDVPNFYYRVAFPRDPRDPRGSSAQPKTGIKLRRRENTENNGTYGFDIVCLSLFRLFRSISFVPYYLFVTFSQYTSQTKSGSRIIVFFFPLNKA